LAELLRILERVSPLRLGSGGPNELTAHEKSAITLVKRPLEEKMNKRFDEPGEKEGTKHGFPFSPQGGVKPPHQIPKPTPARRDMEKPKGVTPLNPPFPHWW
jgi:hypothetical protein